MYAGNNPIRNLDPTGLDWFSYEEEYEDENGEKQKRTKYAFSTEFRSQKDMDKAGVQGKYLGLTKKVEGKYLSLFGQEFSTETADDTKIAKMVENLDNAIMNDYRPLIRKGLYSDEPISYSQDMSVPGMQFDGGKKTVFNYAGGTVYYQIADNMTGGVFDWGDGQYQERKSQGLWGSIIPGYHAKVDRSRANADFDVLFWTFRNKSVYELRRMQADKLFKGRKGYR
jgi:hypothetical protein